MCAAAAQSVQNAALALQGEAVLRHQMGTHLIHKVAVQVIDAPALHALQVQVLAAVAALVHILEHGLFALIGHIFHNALLACQFVQIPVHRGGIGAGPLCLQMFQNVGCTDRVLAVVDEIIQDQLPGFGVVPPATCHGISLPFWVKCTTIYPLMQNKSETLATSTKKLFNL